MWDGTTKLIKDVKVGDELTGLYIDGMIDASEPNWKDWTSSINSIGVYKEAHVVQAQRGSYEEYYYINNDIKITVGHPILINKKNTDVWAWVDSPFIEIGDNMKNYSGELVEVTSIEKIIGTLEVMYIDVEDIDNYFAGETLILVHNFESKEPV